MDQRETPLLTQLEALANSERLSFHMPGNRGGRSFPPPWRSGWAALETTELDCSDDLNRPSATALRAEELAAEAFGAGATLFFTSGSTIAIYTMLAAACGAGGKVLVDPCSHRSLAHIAAWLDLELDFLPMQPSRSARSPLPKPDVEALADLLEQAPQAYDAIYLTSPDYYGRVTEVAAIAVAAKRHGVMLLCDEAHGAAYTACPEIMPPSALRSGADMVTQSLHKTLPALAPASVLHLSEQLLQRDAAALTRARRARPFFQSSSPSFPVAASMDYARSYLACHGRERLAALAEQLQRLAEHLPASFRLIEAEAGHDDPTRPVIDCRLSGLSARAVAAALSEQGIDLEMADESRLVLIPALDQPEEDFLRLAEALREISPAPSLQPFRSESEDKTNAALMRSRPTLKPRNALLSGLRAAPIGEREARAALKAKKRLLAAACLSPYPPGIPLFYPGEELSADDLQLLRELLEDGVSIPDCGEGHFPILIQ